MLISRQQQFVLDILQRLGCARKDQLAALLKVRFFPPEKAVPPGFVDAILRQFRCCNIEVRQEGGTVFLPEKAPNARLLEAVDVMLEMSGANPSDFWAEGKGPVLLRFSVAGKKISLFAVIHASALTGPDVRAPPDVGKAERVVVLLSGDGPPPALNIPNSVFYALRQKDGSHRFFALEQT